MRVAYEFTPEDFLRMNQHFVRHDPDAQRKKRQNNWYFPLAYLMLGMMLLGMGDKGFATGFIIGAVVWGCFYPLFWDYSSRHRIKKAIAEAQKEGYFGKHEVVIEAEGVTNITPHIKVQIKWSSISKVTSGEAGIFIHTSSQTAIAVPNSAFTTSNTQEQFLEEMMRYREQSAGLTEML